MADETKKNEVSELISQEIDAQGASAEESENLSLDALVLNLMLGRLANCVRVCLADGLEGSLNEEVEVVFSQSVECDAVDSFSNSCLCHV